MRRSPTSAFALISAPLLLALLLMPSASARADDHDDEAIHEAEAERLELLYTIAEAQFDKAEVLGEAGRVDDAIAVLDEIKTLPFPDDEDLDEALFRVDMTILGLLLDAERYRDAEPIARGALERIGDDLHGAAELHLILGRILRAQGRADEALVHLDQAVELGKRALQQK